MTGEQPCAACGQPILVVSASRWGGTRLPFDPEPGTGRHYDTMLAADLSHITASMGPLYRDHRWSCPQGLKVPVDRALPDIGGYSHSRTVKAP